MSDMLESSPAGLVIVAVQQTTEDIGRLRPAEATVTTISHSTPPDLGADLTRSTMRTPPGEARSARHSAPRCSARRSDMPTQLRRSPDRQPRFGPWRRQKGEVALISSLWVRAWPQR